MRRLLIPALALGVLAAALLWLAARDAAPAPGGSALTVMCGAGVRVPMEAAAKSFSAGTGIPVHFQFGGSGQLLASLGGGAPADLFIAGDALPVVIGRDRKLLREAIPLAWQRGVVAVAKGNPAGIAGFADLLRPGVRLGLPNPQATSLGQSAQRELAGDGRWDALAGAAAVMKPTVPDLANDLQVGAIDAALLWDANVRQLPALEAVALPELAGVREAVTAAVVAGSPRPQDALRFARWLASPEHGAPALAGVGYEPAPGDAWSPRPTLTLYSGTVNRIGIQATLDEFARREGCEITTVYNGCGILCAAMKEMAKEDRDLPDAYYACDICFIAPVAASFPEALILTEADIIIAVPKGNPRGIKTLADLAAPGLRVGIGNAMQSTLGYMTDCMLRAAGLQEAVAANAVSQVPAGDLLVTQLRAGTLDAAIVYSTNAMPQAEHLDRIALAVPGAKAAQPFAVRRGSPRAQLAFRLLDALRANQDRFTAAGFRWRGDGPFLPSASFPVDPADAHRP